MKKYCVTKSYELYNEFKEFKYESDFDKTETKYFDTVKEARTYCENYKFNNDYKSFNEIFIELLTVCKIDEDGTFETVDFPCYYGNNINEFKGDE